MSGVPYHRPYRLNIFPLATTLFRFHTMTLSTRTPLLALVGFIFLLSGCTSTGFVASWNDGAKTNTAGTAAGGWGAPIAQADRPQTSAPEEETLVDSSPAGACYVKTPHIPGPAEAIQVLKRPERQVVGTDVIIPAQYVSVAAFDDNADGFAWLPSVCERDVDNRLVMKIQEALIEKGYDIGAVDGIAGPSTQAGLEYFKRDHSLYGEGYTYDALRALGVDPQTSGSGFASL
ncbi:MAG: hypothetical protein ACI9W4_001168 [Rhodothermales bacterium]|jgi:hypothetical protein